MKLKKKTFKHYKGKVYDLCVENSHTYNIEGLGVHNSGAGALVSYVLGITQVDPLRWGLMFSRFLREDAGKAEGLILDEEEGREREVIKITTEDGDFSVTPNVELRVKRNNKIINILAKDLKGGDDIISL